MNSVCDCIGKHHSEAHAEDKVFWRHYPREWTVQSFFSKRKTLLMFLIDKQNVQIIVGQKIALLDCKLTAGLFVKVVQHWSHLKVACQLEWSTWWVFSTTFSLWNCINSAFWIPYNQVDEDLIHAVRKNSAWKGTIQACNNMMPFQHWLKVRNSLFCLSSNYMWIGDTFPGNKPDEKWQYACQQCEGPF